MLVFVIRTANDNPHINVFFRQKILQKIQAFFWQHVDLFKILRETMVSYVSLHTDFIDSVILWSEKCFEAETQLQAD